VSVKLRLRRMGTTNRPAYRVVAIDSRNRRDGRAIAELGQYDPLRQPAVVRLKEEAILEWLRRGAEPSPTVRELCRRTGILDKWQMMKRGTGAAEATAKVATRLAARVDKPKRSRPSKKAQAKSQAAPAS